MVGIERMDGSTGTTLRHGCAGQGDDRCRKSSRTVDAPAEVVLVETREGYPVDVGPVIRAALVVQARREANPSGVTAVLLGMRIAIGKVCGGEAATVFEEWVFGDR